MRQVEVGKVGGEVYKKGSRLREERGIMAN